MNQNLLTKSLLFAKKTALGPSDKWKDWLPHFKAQQARYKKIRKHFDTGRTLLKAEILLNHRLTEELHGRWTPEDPVLPGPKQLYRMLKAFVRNKKKQGA